MLETRDTITRIEEELGEGVERLVLVSEGVVKVETATLCILDDVDWQRATETLKNEC